MGTPSPGPRLDAKKCRTRVRRRARPEGLGSASPVQRSPPPSVPSPQARDSGRRRPLRARLASAALSVAQPRKGRIPRLGVHGMTDVKACAEAVYRMQSTAGVFWRSSTPSVHTDLMCASRGTRRSIPAGFKPTSRDRIAVASRLRARPAPPRPGEHSRAANHHLPPRLRRPPRVESDPSGCVARVRIGATQRHRAPSSQLPVTSGRRGIPQGHSSEGPGRLARSVDRVRWHGTHPHAAVCARLCACRRACTPATQRPRRADCRLRAAAQAARGPPA